MTEIYSKAYVMIAANRAKDCDQGCFHVRSSMPSTKLVASIQQETYAQLLKLEMEHSQGIDFRAQPLSMRGWALQERVLANRIVHYNDDQIVDTSGVGWHRINLRSSEADEAYGQAASAKWARRHVKVVGHAPSPARDDGTATSRSPDAQSREP
ncbi:hypothetical protein PWT90_05216 [Aphanocladium album]|nr:hypothetical protein PWT90_05216 [Aphanocladium album]